jgi:DNA-binding IclR family transcriptional regulator
MVKESGRLPVQAVARGLGLLETIAEEEEIGLVELAKRHQMHTSTVHNLLKTLAALGYVISAGGGYRLGPAVLVLASHADVGHMLVEQMEPAVDRLAAATSHGATATTMVGRLASSVVSADGTSEVIVRNLGSQRAQPLSLATGRVLVALGPEHEWDNYITMASDIEPGWSTADWRTELAGIAASGISVRRGRRTNQHPVRLTAVAVPVWLAPSLPSYSLGLSAPWELTPSAVADLVDLLWSEAERLSAELGCPELPLPRPTRMTAEYSARILDRQG